MSVRYRPYYGLANPKQEKEAGHLARNSMRRALGLCRATRASIKTKVQAAAAHIHEVEEYLELLRLKRDIIQCREADCPASRASRRAKFKFRAKAQAADARIHEVEEYVELLRTKHAKYQSREAHADKQLDQVRDALEQNDITEFSQSDDEEEVEGFDPAYYEVEARYNDDYSSSEYGSSEYDSEECSTATPQMSTETIAVDASPEP